MVAEKQRSEFKVLRGMSTVNLWADDLPAATRWYTQVLGAEPYFTSEAAGRGHGYVEFRIADYEHELGIIDRRFAPPELGAGPGGALVYWHVDDVAAALERLVSLGATQLEGVTERGPGFVTASFVDPFGNVLGVMFNRHYLDILGDRGGTREATLSDRRSRACRVYRPDDGIAMAGASRTVRSERFDRRVFAYLPERVDALCSVGRRGLPRRLPSSLGRHRIARESWIARHPTGIVAIGEHVSAAAAT